MKFGSSPAPTTKPCRGKKRKGYTFSCGHIPAELSPPGTLASFGVRSGVPAVRLIIRAGRERISSVRDKLYRSNLLLSITIRPFIIRTTAGISNFESRDKLVGHLIITSRVSKPNWGFSLFRCSVLDWPCVGDFKGEPSMF